MCLSCGCGTDSDHGDSRNITLLILRGAADAAALSVADAAANISASLHQMLDAPAPEAEPEQVMKAMQVSPNPQRFVLGVAYPANRVDGHGEYMRPEELERAAWDYARNHRRIGFYHADGTEGHAEVVESYIWRGPSWETTDIDGREQVIKSGDWVLGAILDEPAWQLVTTRKADGWSVDGVARRRRTTRPNAG